MFRFLCKILFLYLILTFLFSDISSLKEPSAALVRQQYEDVTRTAKRVADYIDGTVIPYVDKKFDEVDPEKSLVGNLVDELNDNGEQEPFSVDEDN
tara:strand:- start:2346 stop:2633 length:288 start_codon:yes stop_codon:yes gene_type:complete